MNCSNNEFNISFEFNQFNSFEGLPRVGEAIDDVVRKFDVNDTGLEFEQ